MKKIFLETIFEKEIVEAVSEGNLTALKSLITSREDTNQNPIITIGKPNVDDVAGPLTVLHEAAYYGRLKIIKWYNEDLDFDNINPFASMVRFFCEID